MSRTNTHVRISFATYMLNITDINVIQATNESVLDQTNVTDMGSPIDWLQVHDAIGMVIPWLNRIGRCRCILRAILAGDGI